MRSEKAIRVWSSQKCIIIGRSFSLELLRLYAFSYSEPIIARNILVDSLNPVLIFNINCISILLGLMKTDSTRINNILLKFIFLLSYRAPNYIRQKAAKSTQIAFTITVKCCDMVIKNELAILITSENDLLKTSKWGPFNDVGLLFGSQDN